MEASEETGTEVTEETGTEASEETGNGGCGGNGSTRRNRVTETNGQSLLQTSDLELGHATIAVTSPLLMGSGFSRKVHVVATHGFSVVRLALASLQPPKRFARGGHLLTVLGRRHANEALVVAPRLLTASQIERGPRRSE